MLQRGLELSAYPYVGRAGNEMLDMLDRMKHNLLVQQWMRLLGQLARAHHHHWVACLHLPLLMSSCKR
jgi:hypothetical protein